MEHLRIECLSCGAQRRAIVGFRHVDPGACPRCGYVGWARVDDLTEGARRVLRERPIERRGLRLV